MKLTTAALAVALGALFLPGPAAAQEARKPQDKPQASQAMPPVPQPGPEHQIFKADEGTWDATVEMFVAPGAPPMVSKGVETNTIGCGGLCLVADFKGEMGGQAFHGHGTSAYDSVKKKYVGSWTDSMSTGLSISEATYDPATKTMTGWMEGPDMTGKVTKTKAVGHYQDANTRTFTMYATGPDGKEVPGLRITYTRKKSGP